MWSCVFILISAAVLSAQSSQSFSTYGYDVNGRRVEMGSMGLTSSNGSSATVETMRNVNGRTVPLESAEEKVVSDGPDGRVIERIVKRYDAGGRVVETVKQVLEERKTGDGGTQTVSSVYRSDVNGRFALEERSRTESRESGGSAVAETVVERPTINGGLDLVEKRTSVARGDGRVRNAETTVLRRDAGGSLRETERQVVVTRTEDGRVTQQIDEYNSAATGKMELAGHKVTTSVKNPDGSETVVTDVFGRAAPGRAVSGFASGPQLRERLIVERRAAPDGSVVEIFSVQRAGLEDGTLGAPRKISERVCSGDCVPKETRPAEPPAQPQTQP
jgi:hypothetical protein